MLDPKCSPSFPDLSCRDLLYSLHSAPLPGQHYWCPLQQAEQFRLNLNPGRPMGIGCALGRGVELSRNPAPSPEGALRPRSSRAPSRPTSEWQYLPSAPPLPPPPLPTPQSHVVTAFFFLLKTKVTDTGLPKEAQDGRHLVSQLCPFLKCCYVTQQQKLQSKIQRGLNAK